MWVYINCENYLIMNKSINDSVVFYLTDLVNIWIMECSLKDLIEKFKVLNPLFDMKADAIRNKVYKLYMASSNAKHKIDKSEELIKLVTADDASSRISLKMEMDFVPSSQQVLYQEFSQHVLSLTHLLHEREQKLVEIIKAKDAEIEEYRLEGVEIKRRAAITTPFDYEEFQNSQMISKSEFQSSLLKGPLGELLGRQTEINSVKSEKREEAETEEPLNKSDKKESRKCQAFESRGCLYKKDERSANSKKRFKLKL